MSRLGNQAPEHLVPGFCASKFLMGMNIFDENYRVIAVESHCLIIRGLLTGTVLMIKTGPESPISEEAFPPGNVVALQLARSSPGN